MMYMFKLVSLVLMILFGSTTDTKSNDYHYANPRVIDGDTIVINNTHYRIFGIDAPELHQSCKDGWLAGIESASYMRAIVRNGIYCKDVGDGKYGRRLAVCYDRYNRDIASMMTRAGYAYAYTQYSKQYVVEETQANSEGIGVHWHGCEKPWNYRKEHK